MGINYVRPTWDEEFDKIREVMGLRATCNRGRSAAVIARDNYLICTGYVSAPKGLPTCDEVGHDFQIWKDAKGNVTQHCIRTVHAEQNAICQAAKLGIAVDGAMMYCTMTPCRTCTMLIINTGITRVVCHSHYSNMELENVSLSLFRQAGVDVEYISEDAVTYDQAGEV